MTPAKFEFGIKEMQRPVASLPLSSRQKAKLKEAGFENTDDIKEVSVAELSRGDF